MTNVMRSCCQSPTPVQPPQSVAGPIRPVFPALFMLLALCCEQPDYLRVRIERPTERSWDAGQVTKVVIRTRNGDVSATAGTDSLVSATVTRFSTGKDSADAERSIEQVEVSMEVEDSTLTIEVEIPDNDPREFGADVALTLPARTAVDLQTTEGDVELDRINARMAASTSRGNVVTHGVRGHLNAWTAAGNLGIDIVDLTVYFEVILGSLEGLVIVYLPDNSSTAFVARAPGGIANVLGFSEIVFSTNKESEKVGVIGSGAAMLTATATHGGVTIRAK